MANNRLYKYVPDYAVPPGETLTELLNSLGMTQHELAARSGRPVKTINELIKGKTGITPETALQFERVFGMPASFWNNLERNYRDALIRIAERKQLERKIAWLKIFPVQAMIRAGWFNAFQNPVDQLRELLNFFGIASPAQWQTILTTEQVAYRKSSIFKSHPVAVAAWLRKGDLVAQEIECQPFDKREFRERLTDIRALTIEEDPHVFVPKLQSWAASAGVAVAFVRKLPGISISGAARWLSSDKALVQLTIRYKTNDHLWFSFFHEVGHILYDRRREVFLDGDDVCRRTNNAQEDRANRFAANILIPPRRYREFCNAGNFSRAVVEAFSAQIKVAPSIIVGRLQHDELLPYNTRLNRLKVRYRWAN